MGSRGPLRPTPLLLRQVDTVRKRRSGRQRGHRCGHRATLGVRPPLRLRRGALRRALRRMQRRAERVRATRTARTTRLPRRRLRLVHSSVRQRQGTFSRRNKGVKEAGGALLALQLTAGGGGTIVFSLIEAHVPTFKLLSRRPVQQWGHTGPPPRHPPWRPPAAQTVRSACRGPAGRWGA